MFSVAIFSVETPVFVIYLMKYFICFFVFIHFSNNDYTILYASGTLNKTGEPTQIPQILVLDLPGIRFTIYPVLVVECSRVRVRCKKLRQF